MTTHTEQIRIWVAPQPQHLHDPHLSEDALYETAAWPCLEAVLGTWCPRVYRRDTEGLYPETDRVLVSACMQSPSP